MEYADLALQSEQLRSALYTLTDEAERVCYALEGSYSFDMLKVALDHANKLLASAARFQFVCTDVSSSTDVVIAAGRQEHTPPLDLDEQHIVTATSGQSKTFYADLGSADLLAKMLKENEWRMIAEIERDEARAERDTLRQQLAAIREALDSVRYEDFYGDCIYCNEPIRPTGDGHQQDCAYHTIEAALAAMPQEQP